MLATLQPEQLESGWTIGLSRCAMLPLRPTLPSNKSPRLHRGIKRLRSES